MAVRHTLFGNETNAEDKSPLPAFAKLPELSHLRVRTESSVYRDIEPKSKIGMPTLIMSDSDDIIVSCHSWFIYSR